MAFSCKYKICSARHRVQYLNITIIRILKHYYIISYIAIGALTPFHYHSDITIIIIVIIINNIDKKILQNNTLSVVTNNVRYPCPSPFDWISIIYYTVQKVEEEEEEVQEMMNTNVIKSTIPSKFLLYYNMSLSFRFLRIVKDTNFKNDTFLTHRKSGWRRSDCTR